jgi:murein DD-endopeptidase MepM/ murein hydrolase activator NlpD
LFRVKTAPSKGLEPKAVGRARILEIAAACHWRSARGRFTLGFVRFVVAVVVVSALGCETPRQAVWDDAPASQEAAPAAVAAPPEAPMTAGVLIDRALQRFLNERASARRSEKTSAVWTEAWDRVLVEIGGACEEQPRASDLGAFVRARVTLEVELEKDRERGVLLPGDLDERMKAVLGAVDESVGELRAANAPGTMAPSPRMSDGDLVLRAPLAPMIVSSPFGVRADPFTKQKRYHNGVDLDAPKGTTVYAAAEGLVVYAGLQGGYGKQVVLDHGDGVRTHYSHLSQILVEPGQIVAEGDAIAYVGSTGRSTGPHLHFGVTNGEDFIDPLAVIDIPFETIATQVKVGTEKERRAFALKKSGDTIEIGDGVKQ